MICLRCAFKCAYTITKLFGGWLFLNAVSLSLNKDYEENNKKHSTAKCAMYKIKDYLKLKYVLMYVSKYFYNDVSKTLVHSHITITLITIQIYIYCKWQTRKAI